jgi:Chaperone of endosialidase
MKKLFLLIAILIASQFLTAQNVGINSTGAVPNASAMLDITSNNMGLLVPRLALTATNNAAPVAAPATSLLVYNTATAGVAPNNVTPGYYYWNGTAWVRFFTGNQSDDWTLLGNAGTNPATNFIGTTDNQNFVVRTNNTERMRVQSDGTVSVGTDLDVNANIYNRIMNTNTTNAYGIYNYHDGLYTGTTYSQMNYNYSATNSTKYGIYNNVNNEGTGGRYGFYNSISQNSASTSTAYGIRNYLRSYGGTSINYGLYNYHYTSGTGTHYGLYNYLYLSGSTVSTNTYASYNLINVGTSTNTSTIYGEYTSVDYNSGIRYGEYKDMNSNSSYTGTIYADYNNIDGTGNDNATGVYNNMAITGTGVKYGIWNQYADVQGTKYGVYNYFPSGTATGTIYGVYNSIQNDANATKYGIRNYINGGTGILYGSSNTVYPAAASTSAIYGVYGYVGSSGTGSHYGLYASAPGGTNDFAILAYAGNSVFNESGGNYDFRVESDAQYDMFLVDASTNRIGINTIAPQGQIQLVSTGENVFITQWDNNHASNGAIGRFQHTSTVNGNRVLMGTTNYSGSTSAASAIIGISLNTTTTGSGGIGVYGSANNESGVAVLGYLFSAGAYLGWAGYFNANVLTLGTYNVSDKRLKRDIHEIDNAIGIIKDINPVSYYYDTERYPDLGLEADRLSYGFIAQELEEVVPEMVKDKNLFHNKGPATADMKQEIKAEEFKVVNYVLMIPILTQAIKEQQVIIEDLEQRIIDMENRLNAMD